MCCTLEVHGIIWSLSRANGKACFSHNGIRIVWEPKMDAYQAQDLGGECILARESPSDCILETTHCVLDMYADSIVPSWA